MSLAPATQKVWLQNGPAAGTSVEVPHDTDYLYTPHPPADVALTVAACVPRVAVYRRDPASYIYFTYVETIDLPQGDTSQ